MRYFAFVALLIACGTEKAELRQLTSPPEDTNAQASIFEDSIEVSQGAAFAFECETEGGAVCYGVDVEVGDPAIASVEELHLDQDVIREIEIEADRLPTGDTRVFLLVAGQPGRTTLEIDYDGGRGRWNVDVIPRSEFDDL